MLTLETCDKQAIERYAIYCDAQGLAQSTRARRLSAIRQLFGFMYSEALRPDNPALRIRGPGRAKSLPKTLSEREVTQLLEAAQKAGRNSGEWLRNTCLLELLYATGMRVSELVSLPAAAARGDPSVLLVRAQGGQGTHCAAIRPGAPGACGLAGAPGPR